MFNHLVLILGLVCSSAIAQPEPATLSADHPERIAWLEENALRIRSIDPGVEDFADLQPLKERIGSARIVQLGEQSHGDGAVFLAKCRLIKFLHQEMGFDVLVWEGGVFDCRRAHAALGDPERPLEDAWKCGIFGIWALSAQARPALEYARATAASERPLETAGYDCQFSSGDAGPWFEALREFYLPLGEHHPALKILPGLEREKKVLAGSATTEQQAESVIQGLQNLAELSDAFRDKLIASHGEDEFTFLRRTIDDAIASARAAQGYLKMQQGERNVFNHRDQRMGENLIWLANERYQGRKLIVWAATMHEVHDVTAIRATWDADAYKDSVIAGTVAKAALQDDLYTIGFDAHDGYAGTCFQQPRPISASPAGSLGALLAELDHPFLYLDFRSTPADHWLRSRMIARPLGYAPTEAVWPDQLDAIFFIRTMFASTQRKLAPETAVLTVAP